MNDRSNITILVIEDTGTLRTLLKSTVEQLGYSCVAASSGSEGLRLLHETSPSLVLLDVIMPDLDGYTVAKAIRARAKFLPIILLTSLTDVEAKRRGQAAGADDFLTKPVQPMDLEIRIAAMLRIKFLTDTLASEKSKLSKLVETIPDGVCVSVDADLVFANGAMTLLLQQETLIGRPLLTLIADADRQKMRERLQRFASTGAPGAAEEFRFVRPDGAHMVLECTGVATEYDGKPALLEIVRDMTDTKRMREQLLLRDRMSSVGTLAAGVGHEINNPLAFILGNLEFSLLKLGDLIDRGNQPEELAEIAQALEEASVGGDRIRRIVRDLNIFCRSDNESSATVDLHSVLDWTAQMAGNEIRHRARLVKDYGDVPLVQGSEVRLSQVFLNLLMNAAQAIPAGNAPMHEISIVTRREGAKVSVEIRDTGRGILPDVRQRLFEPFFTTKPVGEGLGLGLSVSYGIVRHLGGDISVESEPGKGSSFKVTLLASTQPGMSTGARSSNTPSLRRGRVLVIDDEPLVGRAMRRMLPEHDVTIETQGREALKRIEAGEHFDLILCDLMMPEMSGIGLFDWMSTISPGMAGRTIFITGGAFTPEAEEFLRHANRPVLEKPMDQSKLRRLLQQELGNSDR